ncbi:hypothetical protein NAT51_10240 [Flavobacterium amniphilum]|uniref:hypothetical protein n=1 Tax=Flavobacterium amniphilum TaxID=1834035 RepID=UPI00202A259B|nr:hypothetical protein [Flavobacterium amniphilum]MCL9805903.1 hypothetical protein [Flavobacterium amniphilum]
MGKKCILVLTMIFGQLVFCQTSASLDSPDNQISGNGISKGKGKKPTTDDVLKGKKSLHFLKLALDYSNVEIKFDGKKMIAGELTSDEVKKFCSNSFEGEILTRETFNASYNVGISGFGSDGKIESSTVCLKKFALFYKLVNVRRKSDKAIIGSIILGYGYSLDVNVNSKEKQATAKYSSIASLSASKSKFEGNISLSKFGIPTDKVQITFPSISKVDESSLQLGSSMLENAKTMIVNAVGNGQITPRLTVIGFIPIDDTDNETLYKAILDLNDPSEESKNYILN